MIENRYKQVNGWGEGEYVVKVNATQEQLDFFEENGYLIVEDAITPEQAEKFRQAIDELIGREFGDSKDSLYGKEFGGHFLRGLLDKHEAFHDILVNPKTTSIMQAMLGPRIQIRSFSSRITYPGTCQETVWHIDQPSWIEPNPPFYAYPPVINCIYFLDDVVPEMGPLYVVPGTHKSSKLPPKDYYGPVEGEIPVCVKAGTAVLTSCALWHRGGANTENGRLRRNLLVDHSPVWMKDAAFGGVPSWGGELTRKLLAETTDPLVQDLLGKGGTH
jgi:ectoine hydroxylase-related dioxygenase (phytanoyl-CoA dioxygenase family)